jgi:disulfide bond formation protein DsbB
MRQTLKLANLIEGGRLAYIIPTYIKILILILILNNYNIFTLLLTLLCILISAPLSTRHCTTSVWPFIDAHIKAVHPTWDTFISIISN